ncbi:hypothetical protein [Yoonia sp.]|uniref:hypothetical protein n=1 Tax=Yoonia sp. TaxID=2212373 RepID=UPI0025CFD62D|nr:hypothetical protein [Yoonia sp.]
MLRLRRYPVIAVLVIAGAFTVILAYATLNLFQTSMANIRFLRAFGWVAVMEGGLVQLAEIMLCAIAAMLSYIGFKICESELVYRYRAWQDR